MTREALFDRPRLVAQGEFDVAPSCLGFGCASLGSRVGARAGERALHEAFDAGVTWFDVAPAYGAGAAETLLAPFLAGRRDRLVLTTKVGLAPPARHAAMRLAYAMARPALGALGGLRRAARRAAATANRAMAIDGALVESSIAHSLRRLRTDRVDVYALHDPDPADIARDDVLRALERTLARGQARQIAVAGDAAACRAALAIGAPFTLMQTSVAQFSREADAFAASRRVVLHSVFGVAGARDRLLAALAADRGALARLVAAGYPDEAGAAATALLIDAAFAANPDGIVLASMFGRGHLAQNLARAGACRAEAPALLAEVLGGGLLHASDRRSKQA